MNYTACFQICVPFFPWNSYYISKQKDFLSYLFPLMLASSSIRSDAHLPHLNHSRHQSVLLVSACGNTHSVPQWIKLVYGLTSLALVATVAFLFCIMENLEEAGQAGCADAQRIRPLR